MKFFNLLLLLGVSSTLISCNVKRNPYFGDDQAQFIVDSVEEEESKRITTGSTGNVPSAFRVIYKACIKTLSGSGLPRGLKFSVVAGPDKQSVSTDINGCINWVEEYKFDLLADQTNLKMKRAIVSNNDYVGTREFEIYWNSATNKASNNIKNTSLIPQNPQEPLEQGFNLTNATATKENTMTVPADAGQGRGGSTTQIQKSSARLALKSVSLKHIKLDQDQPYRVDKNLELFVKHKFQFSANPAFYVNTFDNPEKELVFPAGKYRVTMVFMDDPTLDLQTLTSEVKNLKKINSRLKDPSLTFVPLIHTAVQFISDKNVTKSQLQDYVSIEIKRLAKLDVRSFVAVTIEDVTSGQSRSLKFNGIGYIQNLLDPGEIDLIEAPIEADKLYTESTRMQAQSESGSPLKSYQETKSLVELDLKDLSPTEYVQSTYKDQFPFKEQLEKFLSNKQTKAEKHMFLRSLCSKMFVNESLASLDKGIKKEIDSLRLYWSFRCQDSTPDYMSSHVVDFVETTKGSAVKKHGKTSEESIKVSRSFERSERSGIDTGFKTESGVSLDAGEILPDVSPLKIGLGASWFYAFSYTKGKSESNGISRESSSSFNITMDTFDLEIPTRRCLVINYNATVIKNFAKRYGIKLPPGYMACSSVVNKPVYREKYYTITQECSQASATTDCASRDENRMRMILRGEKVYGELTKLFENTDINILLSPIAPEFVEDKRESLTTELEKISQQWTSTLTQTSQVYPGALIPAGF